jgi:hypothetical protein
MVVIWKTLDQEEETQLDVAITRLDIRSTGDFSEYRSFLRAADNRNWRADIKRKGDKVTILSSEGPTYNKC